MKSLSKLALCLLLAMSLTVSAFAAQVPDSLVAENLNGQQRLVKIYTLSPEVDPDELKEEDFSYDGYLYTWAYTTKVEHPYLESKTVTETVTVNTAKNDLAQILAELSPSMPYEKDGFSGELALDHTTLSTEASGYTTKYSKTTETKVIGNLDRNDMSYVPATTVKNGKTLSLANVEWQVTGTALVGEALVPAQYQAVATYSASSSYQAATGYVTTAEYHGTVTSEGVDSITYADGSYVDAEGGTLSSTGLYWTDKEGKITISGISGTVVVTEVETIPGYTIDENSRTQTVVVNPNDTQTLHFYNTPIGGVEIIKVNEDNHSERIPNTTFEIRKVDDALVDTVTTDKNGRVFVALEDGSYYAKEVTSNKSFRLDDTPHYFEIKDGKRVTLQVTNKKLSGIVIHKIDSATGEGIYGVKFVLYDANKKPIGEYTSDDEGYIYIDEIPGGLSGRFYLRELEAAPGYTLDKQYKTVYVSPGKTVEIEWENTAVTGQIQIYKYAAEYNEVTGTAAGTPLKGAVYEIVNARSGKVVDYITTDARGVAASKPLPLTRYQIREVTAPAYWQLDPTVHDVTLEYPGQIIKLSAYDKPSSLGVSITKRGNAQVMAGQSMRYDLTVANTSNVPLESFFWHDKIPYDVARPTTLTTGTYSARLNYRILYKTNCNTSYQVLASNLLTSNNYSFSLNAIPMQAGEVVTDIYFDFGKVPVGFQSVVNPTLSVMVNGNAVNGYQMVNRADVGGKYQDTWQTATASWVTVVRRLWSTPTLPKTGY